MGNPAISRTAGHEEGWVWVGSQLTAEQEKEVREVWRNAIPRHDPYRQRDRQPRTGQQETEDDEHPMETIEDNGSDSTYRESTDSRKVR